MYTPFTGKLSWLQGILTKVLKAYASGKRFRMSAYSGIKSLGTSGKNAAADILGKGSVGDMYPTDYGYELGSGGEGINGLLKI